MSLLFPCFQRSSGNKTNYKFGEMIREVSVLGPFSEPHSSPSAKQGQTSCAHVIEFLTVRVRWDLEKEAQSTGTWEVLSV